MKAENKRANALLRKAAGRVVEVPDPEKKDPAHDAMNKAIRLAGGRSK
jgi:hypothetical protein